MIKTLDPKSPTKSFKIYSIGLEDNKFKFIWMEGMNWGGCYENTPSLSRPTSRLPISIARHHSEGDIEVIEPNFSGFSYLKLLLDILIISLEESMGVLTREMYDVVMITRGVLKNSCTSRRLFERFLSRYHSYTYRTLSHYAIALLCDYFYYSTVIQEYYLKAPTFFQVESIKYLEGCGRSHRNITLNHLIIKTEGNFTPVIGKPELQDYSGIPLKYLKVYLDRNNISLPFRERLPLVKSNFGKLPHLELIKFIIK